METGGMQLQGDRTAGETQEHSFILSQQRPPVPGMSASELANRSIVEPSRLMSSGGRNSTSRSVHGPATSTLLRGERRFSDSVCSTFFLPRLSINHSLVKHSQPEPVISDIPLNPVVQVRGADLAYSRKGPKVLDCLSMTVEQGQIYGLLGASGCGKTSLLSVLVGRRALVKGVVQVLGGRPKPGHRLGYMPQEIALYCEFTIRETLQYFGRLYGMGKKEVEHQMEFLTNLLELPKECRTVGTLSGGQQRRVSFAVSLLHDPELYILDEPTVGVDPILRQNIWRHLTSLAHNHGKTVVITTHYIEEARGADRVGFMRTGRLLAEQSPTELLQQYGLPSLEDVFLRLCISDKGPGKVCILGQMLKTKSSHRPTPSIVDPVVATLGRQLEKDQSMLNSSIVTNRRQWFSSCTNMHALLVKNLLKLRRNPAMLLFVFLLPAIQVFFFCVSIGQDPRGLTLGLVNHESGGSCPEQTSGCITEHLGCRLFPGDDRVEVIQYSSEKEGLEDVRQGRRWGLLVLQENFTRGLMARWGHSVGLGGIDQDNLYSSQVQAHMDMSNQQVGLNLQRWVIQSISNFTTRMLSSCNLSPSLQAEAVVWQTPVYGEQDPSFTEFMAPGIIILIIYFLAVALTGESFISERAGGLLERSWVAGVTPGQVLASHILVQFCVMTVQTTVTLTTIILGFSIPCHGPVTWLAVLTMLQGLAGMSFGFLISGLCDSQAVAMQLSIGSFYPNLLLSGILWPLEGMPAILQYVAKFLPNTLACQAMRDIMLRGWDIDKPEVYLGVISSSIWIAIFLILSWIVVKAKS